MSTLLFRGLMLVLALTLIVSPLPVSAQSTSLDSLIDGICLRSAAQVKAATPDLAGDDWQRSLAFVLRYEGSRLSVDSNGAMVKFGINQASHPREDVRHMTLARASELYRTIYWKGSGASALDWPMNLIVFDTAVLFGRGVPAQWMSAGHDTPELLIRRRSYSHLHSKFGTKYRRGWCNRLEALAGIAFLPQ